MTGREQHLKPEEIRIFNMGVEFGRRESNALLSFFAGAFAALFGIACYWAVWRNVL